jgi:hypothetical protein
MYDDTKDNILCNNASCTETECCKPLTLPPITDIHPNYPSGVYSPNGDSSTAPTHSYIIDTAPNIEFYNGDSIPGNGYGIHCNEYCGYNGTRSPAMIVPNIHNKTWSLSGCNYSDEAMNDIFGTTGITNDAHGEKCSTDRVSVASTETCNDPAYRSTTSCSLRYDPREAIICGTDFNYDNTCTNNQSIHPGCSDCINAEPCWDRETSGAVKFGSSTTTLPYNSVCTWDGAPRY